MYIIRNFACCLIRQLAHAKTVVHVVDVKKKKPAKVSSSRQGKPRVLARAWGNPINSPFLLRLTTAPSGLLPFFTKLFAVSRSRGISLPRGHCEDLYFHYPKLWAKIRRQ